MHVGSKIEAVDNGYTQEVCKAVRAVIIQNSKTFQEADWKTEHMLVRPENESIKLKKNELRRKECLL